MIFYLFFNEYKLNININIIKHTVRTNKNIGKIK